MIYSFQPEAEQELIAAVAYYEERHQKLGIHLSEEVFSAIDLILAFPKAWPPIKGEYRRILLNSFPFGIIYKLSADETKCIIYAIMHLHRKSDYWKNQD